MKNRVLFLLPLTAPLMAALAATPGQSAAADRRVVTNRVETVTVRQPHRPAVQTYPHAGVVDQPRRVTSGQNTAPSGRQGPWGAFTRGNGEAAGFGPVGIYGDAPWAEDWSFLRDRSLSKDPFDPLKFIALNESRTIWLTLSGETRLRNWYEGQPYLGTRGTPGAGRFAVRNLYGADLHLGAHVRLFGQLINGDAAGWAGYGYNGTYRKRLDLQQGFVEVTGGMFGARTGLLVGRQQFLDAPSYVLYNRNTPNVPLSWNGVRGYAIWQRVRVDLYDFVGTNINESKMFHDDEDWGTRLHGLDMTFAPGPIRLGQEELKTYLDLFAIGFRLAGASAAVPYGASTLSGSTARQNGGFRWYGSSPSFEFSVGGLYQSGTFQDAKSGAIRDVAAYSVNTTAGYRNPRSHWHPFIGGQFNLYSGGDSRRKTGSIGTYIAPFNPQTNYLDTTAYIAPSNLITVSPILRVTPLSYLSFQLKSPFLWRDDVNDRIYSSSGAYGFRPSGGFVGVIPQAALTLQLGQHLSWTQYAARFIASNGMSHAGAQSGNFYQSNFVFRF